MIIIISKEGQLANRMWQLNAYIVNARKHGYKIYHLFFDEYYDVFSESLSQDRDLPVRFIRKKRLRKLFLKTHRLLNKWGLSNSLWFSDIVYYDTYEDGSLMYDLNAAAYLQKAKKGIVFLKGWFFGEDISGPENRELLKKIWTPNRVYRERVQQVLHETRQQADVVVGVHIRRGDYVEFNGGIWYFDNLTYKRLLQQFCALPEFAGKRVSFILCSNETIDAADFDGLQVVTASRHFIEDLYLLAGADYIIGPPSTYSMWASYYGASPLLQVFSKDQTLQLADFRLVDKFPHL